MINFNQYLKGNIIHLATAQHTGTWFMIEFFKRHSRVRKTVLFKDIEAFHPNREFKYLIHRHFRGAWDEGKFAKKNSNRALGVIYSYAMINYYKTIITLRDPLKSLITRQIRHPELGHEFIIRAFMSFPDLTNIAYFMPIDLDVDETWRYRRLKAVLNYVDLDVEDWVSQYARDWEVPKYNVTQDHYLKKLYRERNLIELGKEIPEIEILIDEGNDLKVFLRDRGYKNLLWW